jgi:photosystem II stability/assembly factor-like uncharacterized protein
MQSFKADSARAGRCSLSILLGSLLLLLAACGTSGGGNTQSTSTPDGVAVNGFGSAANHVHALLAFPDHVLVLATHYGLFRSQDGGATWKEVAAGPSQLMQGLMTYELSSSSLDPRRLYVLTLTTILPHSGTLGLYSSDDQGQTWQLATPTASLTPNSIYTVAAGNASPTQVYVYLPDRGTQGLRVSLDAGRHFSATGTLPFGGINHILALPGAPGQLLASSSDGLARSVDGGVHWQVIKNVDGGIYSMTSGKPHSPIYASGDAGVYVSLDGGKSFTLRAQNYYTSLTVSPSQPQIVYGETGIKTYRSSDGGHTWTALPHIAGNLNAMAANPDSPDQVYLALSYPTAIYQLQPSGSKWQSLTPRS